MRIVRLFAVSWIAAVALCTSGWFACAQPPAVADAPPRVQAANESLGIASVSNLRDVGGYATRDGFVVRKNLLFRSNQLGRISGEDLKKIERLGLKCDFDLRREHERTGAPDMLPTGVKNIWLNVMADSQLTDLPSATDMLRDTTDANAEWGRGKMEARFLSLYREFISLPGAQKAYHQLFTDLGKQENLPALFHCSAGKDRTGWAAAALLSLLGVPREVVYEDYLRSNDYALPTFQSTIESFAKAGGEPTILPAMLGVKKEYLTAAFDEVQAKYGTIEEYFAKGLEIDAAGQQALRDRFLTRPSN